MVSMQSMDNHNSLYLVLAEVLDYPSPALLEQVKSSVALLGQINQDAVFKMSAFRLFVETTPLAQLEEIYTSAFDLQPACYPYAGYHLFGESYRRGEFLAKLKARYSAIGFSSGNELPDHIAVLLRYLSLLQDENEQEVIVSECLLPALAQMETHLKGENPYLNVLQSVLIVLRPSIAADEERNRKKMSRRRNG